VNDSNKGSNGAAFGLWRVCFPPCLVRPGRRLPVQGLSEGSLGYLDRLPPATAEGGPPSEHAQDHADQHGDVAELRDLKQQVKQQEAKLLQLEKLLLTGHRIARDDGIDDVREFSTVVSARDFGSAQGGVTFVAPGHSAAPAAGFTWPPPVTASVHPGSMITPMTPFESFPGYGAFTFQGLNTRNNGTEDRPQTTAAVAAAGDKKHGRPFKWSFNMEGKEKYLDDVEGEVTDHEQRATMSEILSTGELLSCLLGPEAPKPEQGERVFVLGQVVSLVYHPDVRPMFSVVKNIQQAYYVTWCQSIGSTLDSRERCRVCTSRMKNLWHVKCVCRLGSKNLTIRTSMRLLRSNRRRLI